MFTQVTIKIWFLIIVNNILNTYITVNIYIYIIKYRYIFILYVKYGGLYLYFYFNRVILKCAMKSSTTITGLNKTLIN